MDILDRLIEHDMWATQALLEQCLVLDDDTWTRSFDIGPGSLAATFGHVIGCWQNWTARIGDQPRSAVIDQDRAYSAASLLEAIGPAAQSLAATLRRVRDEDRFDEIIEFPYEDKLYRFTRGTAAVHVLTHGMHHRAQIINMLRRAGHSATIDGDAIEWEIAARPDVATVAITNG